MKKIGLILCLTILSVACSLPFTITFPTVTTDSATPVLNPDDTTTGESGDKSSTPTGSDLDPAIAAQMDSIEAQTISIRGLQPSGPVARAVLTSAQLRDHVINNFFADYTAEEAQADTIELSAIGLLEPGFDLYQLYIDLYSEQIAGFYDDETGELYVVQGEAFLGPQRMTHSHEYTHALQDQNYHLRSGLHLTEEECRADTEYCAGATALIEGDASLTEQLWYMQYATQEDQQQISDFYASYQSPVYDSAPYFLQQDFLFPYDQGLTFVYGLYQQGGWQAVDAAYANPPVSTEQIMHPERYPNDHPQAVEMADLTSTLGAGWREETRNVMGEWYTYLILSAGVNENTRLSEDVAAQAAQGWAGDTYLLYLNADNSQYAFIQFSEWETIPDANEFWQAMQQYAIARWGMPDFSSMDSMDWQNRTEGAISLRRISQTSIAWVIAPNLETCSRLIADAN